MRITVELLHQSNLEILGNPRIEDDFTDRKDGTEDRNLGRHSPLMQT